MRRALPIQTASSHLAKLEQGDLLLQRKQGRHKYFSLASDEVAQVLESLMGLVAGNSQLHILIGPRDEALRKARYCYNHLAGDMGIRLYRSLLHNDYIKSVSGSLTLTKRGHLFVTEFGIDVDGLIAGRAALCRDCMDWSERQSHLAGSLGRAFLSRFEDLRWMARVEHSRVARFTKKGEKLFNEIFSD